MFSVFSNYAVMWFWMFFGIIFIIIELFVLSYHVIWIGISAFIVGIAGYIFEIHLIVQIVLWIVLSFIFEAFRISLSKSEPIEDDEDPNHDYYSFNHKGTVVKEIVLGEKGIVHLDAPWLGDIEWYARAYEPLKKGERIRIKEIRGQLLIVEKDKT